MFRTAPRISGFGISILILALGLMGCQGSPSDLPISPEALQAKPSQLSEDPPGSWEDPPGSWAEPPNAQLIFAYVHDANSGSVLVQGFSGAINVSSGISEVWAQNLDSGSAPIMVAPNADGSFSITLSGQHQDEISIWTGGKTFAAGGPGKNDIREIVQYWSQRLPLNVRSIERGRFQDTQGVDRPGYFVASKEGLFFLSDSEVSGDPQTISPVKFKIAHGLTSNSIFALHVDLAGNLWVGGQSSEAPSATAVLQRLRFANGKLLDEARISIPSTTIREIASDHRGRLLLGTERALFRVSPETETVELLLNKSVMAILSDGNDGFFIGTAASFGTPQLYHLTDTEIGPSVSSYFDADCTVFRTDCLPGDFIYDLLAGPDGKLWAAREYGVSRIEFNAERVMVSVKNEAMGHSIAALSIEENGTVWGVGRVYATSEKTLHRFRAVSDFASELIEIQGDAMSSLRRTIRTTSSGQVLIGTECGTGGTADCGLTRLDPMVDGYVPTFFGHRSAEDLPSPRVKNLLQLDSKRLLVATDRGIRVLNLPTGKFSGLDDRFCELRVIATFPCLDSASVNDLVADGRGGFWLATGAGFAHVDMPIDGGSHVEWYQTSELLPELSGLNGVSKIEMALGYLWIIPQATTPRGLVRVSLDADLRPSSAFLYETSTSSGGVAGVLRSVVTGFPSNTLHDLAAVDGALWVSSSEGLIRFTPNGTSLATNTYLPGVRILEVAAQSAGDLWFATASQLYRFHVADGTARVVSSISRDTWYTGVALHLDEAHRLWLGSAGENRMVRFQETTGGEITSTTITSDDGLVSHRISTFVSPHPGSIFAGTIDSGVFLFNGADSL